MILLFSFMSFIIGFQVMQATMTEDKPLGGVLETCTTVKGVQDKSAYKIPAGSEFHVRCPLPQETWPPLDVTVQVWAMDPHKGRTILKENLTLERQGDAEETSQQFKVKDEVTGLEYQVPDGEEDLDERHYAFYVSSSCKLGTMPCICTFQDCFTSQASDHSLIFPEYINYRAETHCTCGLSCPRNAHANGVEYSTDAADLKLLCPWGSAPEEDSVAMQIFEHDLDFRHEHVEHLEVEKASSGDATFNVKAATGLKHVGAFI